MNALNKPFSELEARTEATAWEDRLLRANVATMRNEDALISLDEAKVLFREREQLDDLPDGQEKYCTIARYRGSKMMLLTLGFDVAVRTLIKNSRKADCCSKSLADDIERLMLEALEASPEYESYQQSLSR